MSGQTSVTLADIASNFTRINSSFQYFHGKLYSFVPPEPERFSDIATSMTLNSNAFPNSHPATLIVGKLAGLISFRTTQVLAVEQDQLRIFARLDKSELPNCNYLAIISPAEKTTGGYSYGRSFESINFLRSLVSLAFGKLPFYAWIADFDFDERGVVSLSGDTIRMPLFADLFKILDAGLMKEISERLVTQQSDYRKRLQRACDFFDMALDQQDETFRFSAYWIALEIVVGGKGDAIRAKLSKAYGRRNKEFANEKLLFKEIEQMRHDLMHKGEFKRLE